MDSETVARDVVHYRATCTSTSRQSSLLQLKEGERGVGVLVKGDVVGSVEVLVRVLETRQPQGVGISVVHSGVGPVVDSDVEMAASTGSELSSIHSSLSHLCSKCNCWCVVYTRSERVFHMQV